MQQTWMDGEIDRSEWGAGPWDGEPDKVQWVDAATGLDCLAVRNSLGNWCGYVGVPESHPLHGVGYNCCPMGEDCDGEDRVWCDHRPESRFRVHGGLTFSDECNEPTEDQYWALIGKMADEEVLREVERHPRGDYSRLLRQAQRASEMTFEEWVAYEMGRRICHVPREGVGEVWWFGFDCAHSGDQVPGMDAYSRRAGVARYRDETYRTLGYVKSECAHLAKQLASVVAS